MCEDYPPASILYLYFSFSFDESPIYVIISSFLRFWLVVASMYLLFLSVRSTFHTRFKPVCSSILYRTSIGHQSDNNRTKNVVTPLHHRRNSLTTPCHLWRKDTKNPPYRYDIEEVFKEYSIYAIFSAIRLSAS